MNATRYDVIVVGAGCGGLTAALGLARAGFTVTVVEAASVPGESGIGGVCFAENLAQPDILGDEGVAALAWERRLIERGRFATDGRRLVGSTYRDVEAFRHCYTVLSPLFTHRLAQFALGHGIALRTETAVESLIRAGRRIIGVATTRGPLYGDLIFLAEGDAGHLVSREGLDRFGDPRAAPAFLYCLQQIVELPPGAIEKCFQVGPEQGVAYDVLLRNDRGAPLNVRGQVCTNRQSLTLNLVLPMEHLRQHFDGEPRQLLDEFAEMPALRPWWREGRRGAWTARLLRAGGPRDVPYLVEDGLAVGGAAAGLGVDFPVMNFTGPATATGLLLSRAAARIRAEGGDFLREPLLRHYVDPLRQTRYWRDMEFLHRWPSYVRRTRFLFDRELDLLLDSAAVWTKPRRWPLRKLLGWFSVLGGVAWGELWNDLVHAGRALRLREVTPRPALARVALDGALNAFRDLARRPRPHLPPAGTLRVHYSSADEEGTATAAPAILRRWYGRFRPVLASAERRLYRNDDIDLSAKLTCTIELLVRQVNWIDLLAVAALGFLTVLGATLFAVVGYILDRLCRRYRRSAVGVEKTTDTPIVADGVAADPSAQETPLIRIVWKTTQPVQRAEAVRTLPHICPAGVFEVSEISPDQVQLAVHGEKCIQCEACWRTNPLVDWRRSGSRNMLGPVFSPEAGPRDAVQRLLDQFDRKLWEYEQALAHEPATIDRPRSDHLEMLARYARQLATAVQESLGEKEWPARETSRRRQVLELAATMAAETEERARRTWDGRFVWAAADGRRLRQHHLTGLRRLLGLDAPIEMAPLDSSAALPTDWESGALSPRAEDACSKHLLADIAARRYLLETLERAGTQTAAPIRAELLAALADDVRAGLAASTGELNTLLGVSGEGSVSGGRPLEGAYHRHGPELLENSEQVRTLLDVPGDWPTLVQRRALLAEREEIADAERRLAALAGDWQQAPPAPAQEAEVGPRFARLISHVLGGKLLLLRTHERLEDGLDSELAMVLLRVWLDYTATRLDEFTIAVRDFLRPPPTAGDRPLVEPGSGAPLRTVAEYLASSAPYTSGDFLLEPVDLLRPRLVPEMVGSEEAASTANDAVTADLLRAVAELRDHSRLSPCPEEAVYLAEALGREMAGRRAHPQTRSLDLDGAAARLVVSELHPADGALRERCLILRELAEEVVPRWLRSGAETAVRHMGHEVLELESLKADFRRRLTAVWQFFGAALGRNPDVQASCFALAEAAAWLKAADSTLGRMAWLSRIGQAEDRDEPAPRQRLGRRVLAHCFAEVRDRLFRFDEDLASLRRGYYAPHVRAASLLLAPSAQRPAPPSVIDVQTVPF